MGLLDKLKAAVDKGEQAVDKIVDATQEATKTVVSKAEDAVNEVVQDGREGAGEVAAESRKVVATVAAGERRAADAVADELRKARGIISGNIDGFARSSSPYYNQVRFGSHAYDLNRDDVGKKRWGEFNAEQQAMIVENWYVGGMSESDDAFTYIKGNIRARNP